MRRCGFVSCLLGLLIAAFVLTGCPAAEPTGTQFVPDPTAPPRLLESNGSLVVAMAPLGGDLRPETATDLAVANFRSPSGHEGAAFVHLPQGWLQMLLVVDRAGAADADMLFEWDVVQGEQVIQHLNARIAAGEPAEVFFSGKPVPSRSNESK